MKKILVFLFLGILFSCSKPKTFETFPIVYQSPNLTLFNQIKYWGPIVIDQKLTLNKDNSYHYTTCSQIEVGKWKRKNDSLFLICENRKFIIDSLNYLKEFEKGTICDSKPDVWIIKDQTIQNVFDKYFLELAE